MKTILRIFKSAAMGLSGVAAIFTIWGFIEPHLLQVKLETAQIPNLPRAWHGQKIGQLSDFQIGMWAGNTDTSRRSVKEMIKARPAVVLISGDFIYHANPDPSAEIKEAVSVVRPLIEAGIPTYAVLGNHDYGMSSKKARPHGPLANQLKVALESAGLVVLENESTSLALPESNSFLYLAAVDSRWANQDNVDAALAQIPEGSPSIALMHNPDSFELFPAKTAPLALAGHTHGGQIRLPNSPQWSWLRFTQKDKVYADGWAKNYGKPGNNLYVNVGIGMSIVPIRIFCRPEMTLFTLEG